MFLFNFLAITKLLQFVSKSGLLEMETRPASSSKAIYKTQGNIRPHR